MAAFSSGKNAYGISDRSGFRYPLNNMRKEWNGLLVGNNEWEAKQSQLNPRKNTADPQALKDPRPSRTEPPVEVPLTFNPFSTYTAGTSLITVQEPGHSRVTGDIVRFRNSVGFDGLDAAVVNQAEGYTITVMDSDTYTFIIASGSAEAGNQKGGGRYASAGPVTLEA